jgi:tetratricopeptide (TPR) repeat protein
MHTTNLENLLLDMGRYPDAVGQYNKAIEKDDAFKYAYINLGWAFIYQKRYPESIEQFRKAGVDKDAYFGWAYALESFGRNSEAIEIHEKALQIDKSFAYSIHNIAAVLERQGHYKEARIKWNEACDAYSENLEEERQKKNASYFLYYGSIYQFSTLKDLDEAERIYNIGLDIDPGNAEILFNLVQLCSAKSNEMDETSGDEVRSARTREYFKAREYFRRAENTIKTGFDFEKNADDLSDLGNLYKEIDNFDEARKYFTEALEIDRTHEKSLTSLGALLMRDEDYRKAVERFSRAMELDPDNLDLRSNLAEAFLKSGLTEKAEREYRAVLDVTPYHMDALIGIGLTYITMGEEANARKDAGNAEVMFSAAGDYYSRIMRLMQDTESASKILNKNERSALYYSKGYNEVMLFEIQKRQDPNRLKTACEDFRKVEKGAPNYYKAQRAITKITERLNPPQGTVDKWGPGLILLFSLIIFILAQGQFVIGKPVLGFNNYSIDKNKFEEIVRKENFEPSVKSKLLSRMQQSPSFPTLDSFSADIKGEFGDKVASAFNPYEILKGSGGITVKAFQPMETGYYVLATFGSLLFMVAGLYLRQISKLKVGALELEKSTIDQISTSTSLGITR